MALFTIIKYALAFFIGYLVFIIVGPFMYGLRYENPMWDNMPLTMTAFGDIEYGIWILFTILIAAVILVAGMSEANRQRNVEA